MFLCAVLAVGAPWVAASIVGEAVDKSSSEDDQPNSSWDLHYALTPSMLVQHYQVKNVATDSLQQVTATTSAYQALASINYHNRRAVPKKPTTKSDTADVTHHVAGLVGTILFISICSTVVQVVLYRGLSAPAARMWAYLAVLATDVFLFVLTVAALGTWAQSEVKGAACASWIGKGAVTANQSAKCGYSDGYNAAIVLVVFSVFHFALWAYGLRGDAVGELAGADEVPPSSSWGGGSSGAPPSNAASLKQPLSASEGIEGAYQISP